MAQNDNFWSRNKFSGAKGHVHTKVSATDIAENSSKLFYLLKWDYF